MAASMYVPAEEYLQTTYEPDREYVDVGEYYHGRLQLLIAALLLARAGDGDHLQSGASAVRVVDRSKRGWFVADAAGLRGGAQRDLAGTLDFNDLFRRLDEPAE